MRRIKALKVLQHDSQSSCLSSQASEVPQGILEANARGIWHVMAQSMRRIKALRISTDITTEHAQRFLTFSTPGSQVFQGNLEDEGILGGPLGLSKDSDPGHIG
ncbi:unnamed protein product [Closterium sp. Naga37s-1]|nr:unnamed protein product [Closterium sp. Naga37s-1]